MRFPIRRFGLRDFCHRERIRNRNAHHNIIVSERCGVRKNLERRKGLGTCRVHNRPTGTVPATSVQASALSVTKRVTSRCEPVNDHLSENAVLNPSQDIFHVASSFGAVHDVERPPIA